MIGEVMISLGQKPTEVELMIMIKEMDSKNTGNIEVSDFMSFIARKI